jgi:hypothetical protein
MKGKTLMQRQFVFSRAWIWIGLFACAITSSALATGETRAWRLTCAPGCEVDMQNIRISQNGVQVGFIPMASCNANTEGGAMTAGTVNLSDPWPEDLHASIARVQCTGTPATRGTCDEPFILPDQVPWGVHIFTDSTCEAFDTASGLSSSATLELVAAPPFVPAGFGDDTCQTAAADLGIPCSQNVMCAPPATCGLKSRYITITPGLDLAGAPTSIKVTIIAMPMCPAMVGTVWSAGPSGPIPNPPAAPLLGARLQPGLPIHAEFWPMGPLHLYGPVVVPGSTYAVSMCVGPLGILCSPAWLVDTGKWGDVVRPFGGFSQPNFSDINSVISKFRILLGSPDTPRADLVGSGNPGAPNTPNRGVDFGDISADVSAFRGFPYPYTVSAACP